MSFEAPRYSKTVVDKAGALLRRSLTEQVDQDELAYALEVLSNWRASHSYIINTFQATLRDKTKKLDVNSLIAQRLKRMPSILNKLRLRQTMRLSTMQDIAGIRVVVDSIADVTKIAEAYRQASFSHARMPEDDYIANPKVSGYRSLHQIYKYKNLRIPRYDGLFIELQIRTKTQHAWATAVETVDTFLKYSLKSSEGPEEWKNYFAQSSSALAHLESCQLVPGFDGQSKAEAFRATCDAHARLGVESKLQGYRLAASLPPKAGGSFYLLDLDTRNSRLTYRSYGRERLSEASAAYMNLEKTYAISDDHQIVLVSAQSLSNLRRAYPNYFLDSHEYLKLIKRMSRQQAIEHRDAPDPSRQ
jgi:putative GTP pyrophosphokinase